MFNSIRLINVICRSGGFVNLEFRFGHSTLGLRTPAHYTQNFYSSSSLTMAFKKVAQSKALPPLPKLKLKNPVLQKSNNKCYVLMSSLLNCWAANGEGSAPCSVFENDLKTCMETFKSLKETVGSANYHAARLYPKFRRVND